jgi:hypothetical protein
MNAYGISTTIINEDIVNPKVYGLQSGCRVCSGKKIEKIRKINFRSRAISVRREANKLLTDNKCRGL